MIQEALQRVVRREDLSTAEARQVMLEIMDGTSTHSQIAAFITAMRMKGETEDELTGFALTMRERAARISSPSNAVDLCGTGGDGKGTLNISTIASFVVAATGIPVAKHGNRAVSSLSGSADVLNSLGIPYDLDPAAVQDCIGLTGFGFMFAPVFHQSMRNVMVPRKEIGIRTFFNMLGPMTNPAGVRHQLIGVYDSGMAPRMARALQALGTERALLVHSEGTDEITNLGETHVTELLNGKVRQSTITPDMFGIDLCEPSALVGGSPQDNARAMISILKGERSPRADAVVLNAGAALYAAGAVATLQEGADLGRKVLESGRGMTKLSAHAEVAIAKELHRQRKMEASALRNRKISPEVLKSRSSEISADLSRVLSASEDGRAILHNLDKRILSGPSVLTVLALRRAVRILSDGSAPSNTGGKAGRNLSDAISQAEGLALIGEYKPSSPSSHSLVNPPDPQDVADAYLSEGLSGVSVLTEPDFFHGGEDLFSTFRSALDVPMISKDFVVSTDQIDAASQLGADAVLLISTILNHDALGTFVERAITNGIEPLVEVHDTADLEKVANSGAASMIKLIGVNSRDLGTLDTDLGSAIALREALPSGVLTIAESGVRSPMDLKRLDGFDAALVGTMFMTAEDLRSRVHDAMAIARSM